MTTASGKKDIARNIVSILLATAIVIACAILVLEAELRLAVPLLISVTAAMTILLACTLYLGERGKIENTSFGTDQRRPIQAAFFCGLNSAVTPPDCGFIFTG
jgi:hypothetical protein